MSLSIAEIRDTAERLKGAIAAERYETKAGLKKRSAFGPARNSWNSFSRSSPSRAIPNSRARVAS